MRTITLEIDVSAGEAGAGEVQNKAAMKLYCTQ